MAQRQFVRFFGPLLRALEALNGEAPAAAVRQRIVHDLNIGKAEQTARMPGGSSRFGNQIAWARFYLAKADLIDSPRRGVWRITSRGRTQLKMSEDEAFALTSKIERETRDKRARKQHEAQPSSS